MIELFHNRTNRRKGGRAQIACYIGAMTFCVVILGCQTTRTYWTPYDKWSDWHKTSQSRHQTLSIFSDPPNSSVYVNGTYRGTTPIKISLSYPRLKRTRVRYQKREEYSDMDILWNSIGQLTTLGTTPEIIRPRVNQVGVDEDVEYKSGHSKYKIALKKSGYVPHIVEITVPGRIEVIRHRFIDKPTLLLYPFHVEKSIEQASTAFEALWDNFFSNERGLAKKDYARLGEKLALSFTEYLSLTQVFSILPNRSHDDPEQVTCADDISLKSAAAQGAGLLICGEVGVGKEEIEIKVRLVEVRSGHVICIENRALDPAGFPRNAYPALKDMAEDLSKKYPTMAER